MPEKDGRTRDAAGLNKAHADLETRASRRTAQLNKAKEELETEIAERRKAEAELLRHKDRLEDMVRERTGELQTANEKLQSQAEESAAQTEELAAQAEDLRMSNEELRRQDQALRRSAQFPQENPNPVLRITVDGTLLYANAPGRAWLATFGGRADGPLPDAVRAAVAQARGGTGAVETEITSPAGSTFYIVAVQPPGEDYVNVYGIDITERKQAEEALRTGREDLSRAQSVGQIGSWRLDVNRNVLMWSDENHRIFAIPEGTPLTYETFMGTVHPDDRQYVDTRWKAGLRGEPYDIQHRIMAEGQVKWVREKAYLEFDDAGRLLGGFGITQDITERKQAEENLRRLNESLEQRVRDRTAELHHKNRELKYRAEQLARLASELTLTEQRERHRLAKVLHDHLQQLLVGAKLGLQGLASSAADKELGEAIHDVYELINQSIAASRSLTVELSPTILHEVGLAAGLEWLARWMEQKHGLVVDLHTQPNADTDREDIRILLFESVRELLFNVVKHAGVTRAKVTLARRDGDLDIVVSDEGTGFDPARLHDIGGATVGGFGLFSIRERLGLLGGSLKIESAPQRGSRFTLVAPAVYPEKAVEPKIRKKKAAAEREEPAEVAAAGPRLRILIVDDHSILRQAMAARLKREPDLEIAGEAGNGAEAVDKARQLRPDVILMDFSMPRMDGVEATRRIHGELPHIRVVGLSMYEEADRARAMLDAGASAYVTKSAELDELLRAIRSAANSA
jgi:PAS domain S-box-containing protein